MSKRKRQKKYGELCAMDADKRRAEVEKILEDFARPYRTLLADPWVRGEQGWRDSDDIDLAEALERRSERE